MHQVLELCLFVIIFGLAQPIHSSVRDYINLCRRNDPNLSDCIINSINKLRPHLIPGIPELDIPSLDPLNLDTLVFGSGKNAGLKGVASNLEIRGTSAVEMLKLNVKFTKNGFNTIFEINIPSMNVTGKYKLDSKILLLNLKGEGPLKMNITDCHAVCTMNGYKIRNEKHTHLQFDTMQCDLDIGNANIFLGNLFNGNDVLTKATNDAINENYLVFFEEIKPDLLASITKMFTDLANKITFAFEYDELFL